MSYSAGLAIFEALNNRQNILMITGFPVPSPFSLQGKPAIHSDGPIGIVCLLKALALKGSPNVTVLTDNRRDLNECLEQIGRLGKTGAHQIAILTGKHGAGQM